MGNCSTKDDKAEKNITLAIFGIDNAGKTTILKSLQGNPLDDVTPTVGFTSFNLKYKKQPITVYDLGGGARIRNIWKNYLPEVYGIMYAIDASDPARLKETGELFTQLVENPKIQGKPILLLLNKQDIEGAFDEVDATESLSLQMLVNKNKCPCRVETCSATHGTGKKQDPAIDSGFHWLTSWIAAHWDLVDRRVREDVAAHKKRLEEEKQSKQERVRKLREQREKEEAEAEAANHLPNSVIQPISDTTEDADSEAALHPSTSANGVGHRACSPNDASLSSEPSSYSTSGQVTKLPPILEQQHRPPGLPGTQDSEQHNNSGSWVRSFNGTGNSVNRLSSADRHYSATADPLELNAMALFANSVASQRIPSNSSPDSVRPGGSELPSEQPSLSGPDLVARRRRRRKRLKRSNRTLPSDAVDDAGSGLGGANFVRSVAPTNSDSDGSFVAAFDPRYRQHYPHHHQHHQQSPNGMISNGVYPDSSTIPETATVHQKAMGQVGASGTSSRPSTGTSGQMGRQLLPLENLPSSEPRPQTPPTFSTPITNSGPLSDSGQRPGSRTSAVNLSNHKIDHRASPGALVVNSSLLTGNGSLTHGDGALVRPNGTPAKLGDSMNAPETEHSVQFASLLPSIETQEKRTSVVMEDLEEVVV